MSKGYCIIEMRSGWAVRKMGETRSIKTGLGRREAWAEARSLAKKDGASAFILDEDKKVAARVNF